MTDEKKTDAMVVLENGQRKENQRLRDRYLDEKFDHIDEKFTILSDGMKEARADRKDLFKAMDKMGKDVAGLKVKAGIWGGVGAGSVLVVAYLKSLLVKP